LIRKLKIVVCNPDYGCNINNFQVFATRLQVWLHLSIYGFILGLQPQLWLQHKIFEAITTWLQLQLRSHQ